METKIDFAKYFTKEEAKRVYTACINIFNHENAWLFKYEIFTLGEKEKKLLDALWEIHDCLLSEEFANYREYKDVLFDKEQYGLIIKQFAKYINSKWVRERDKGIYARMQEVVK